MLGLVSIVRLLPGPTFQVSDGIIRMDTRVNQPISFFHLTRGKQEPHPCRQRCGSEAVSRSPIYFFASSS
jgi:hypothetical protein